MRQIIIGAGGVGGWLASSLAAVIAYSPEIEDKTLYLIDGDDFEPKNLARQHFVGQGNKATVRASEISMVYPMVDIIPIEGWVVPEAREVDPENKGPLRYIAASALLQDGDVVFPVVDNFACRALICKVAATLDNVDVYLAGNDEDSYMTVYHYQRRNGKDVTWNPLDFKPELQDPPDRNPGEMSCEERARIDGGTQLIATNMAVAALVLYRFIHTIVRKEADSEAEIVFDLKLGIGQASDRRDDEVESPDVPGEGVTAEVASAKPAVVATT